MFDLSGRVALVTGAGQSVGEGIAQLLARQGAAVAVNDLVAERAEAVAESIRNGGGSACAAPFDVTNAEAVADGVREVKSTLGPVDILVNNAGIPPGMGVSSFREMNPDQWAQFVDLNLYGVLHCTRAVIEEMSENGWGRVINISSGAGQTGIRIGVSIYGAAKGAAISFMRHFASEVAGTGVTANTVALGIIDNHGDPTVAAELAKQVPVRKLGQPEDIAPAVLFLASNEASWITGQVLGVNGGSLML